MKIRKTNAIQFGSAVHLATNNHDVVKTLESADSSWRNLQEPAFRFVRISGQQVEADGFIHGVLCNKEEAAAIQATERLISAMDQLPSTIQNKVTTPTSRWPLANSIAESLRPVVIKSVEELRKLDILRVL